VTSQIIISFVAYCGERDAGSRQGGWLIKLRHHGDGVIWDLKVVQEFVLDN
jgi:hypothetical protein